MKALTLTQPWASLVAIGAKTIETRSWRTDYRGIVAIHAAKGMPRDAIALLLEQPFRRRLEAAGIDRLDALPRGAVVAVAELVDVEHSWPDGFSSLRQPEPSSDEFAFGDFGHGRYMWFLEDVRAFTPIIARGSLGLWDWDPPAELAAMLYPPLKAMR